MTDNPLTGTGTADDYAMAAVFMAMITGDTNEVARLLREDFTNGQITRLHKMTSDLTREIWAARSSRFGFDGGHTSETLAEPGHPSRRGQAGGDGT